MEQKIKNIMAEVFGVPLHEIKDDSSAYTIATWDSLKHIDLMLAFEKEFGIRFEDEEISTMVDYRMIVNTIKSYLE